MLPSCWAIATLEKVVPETKEIENQKPKISKFAELFRKQRERTARRLKNSDCMSNANVASDSSGENFKFVINSQNENQSEQNSS